MFYAYLTFLQKKPNKVLLPTTSWHKSTLPTEQFWRGTLEDKLHSSESSFACTITYSKHVIPVATGRSMQTPVNICFLLSSTVQAWQPVVKLTLNYVIHEIRTTSCSNCLDQAKDQELLGLFTFRACFITQLLQQISRENWAVLASMTWGHVVQWDVLAGLFFHVGGVLLFLLLLLWIVRWGIVSPLKKQNNCFQCWMTF